MKKLILKSHVFRANSIGDVEMCSLLRDVVLEKKNVTIRYGRKRCIHICICLSREIVALWGCQLVEFNCILAYTSQHFRLTY